MQRWVDYLTSFALVQMKCKTNVVKAVTSKLTKMNFKNKIKSHFYSYL